VKNLGRSAINTSEDGGFAPPIRSTRKTMDLLSEAIERAGYSGKIAYGLDFAATGFFDTETERYHFEGSKRTPEDMLVFLKTLVKEYPLIVAIEDPFCGDDFD